METEQKYTVVYLPVNKIQINKSNQEDGIFGQNPPSGQWYELVRIVFNVGFIFNSFDVGHKIRQ